MHTAMLFLHLVFAAVWVGGLFAAAHGSRLRPSVFLISAVAMGITGLYLVTQVRPDLLREGLFHLKLTAYLALFALSLLMVRRPTRSLAWAGFGLGLVALFAIAALP